MKRLLLLLVAFIPFATTAPVSSTYVPTMISEATMQPETPTSPEALDASTTPDSTPNAALDPAPEVTPTPEATPKLDDINVNTGLDTTNLVEGGTATLNPN